MELLVVHNGCSQNEFFHSKTDGECVKLINVTLLFQDHSIFRLTRGT